MDDPLVRYATTGDGVSIAYWKLGRGAPLIQLPALPYSHVRVEWDLPQLRRAYELLSVDRTLVRFDGRGTGLSQRDVKEFSLDTMVADLEAVADDLEAEQVALLGVINTAAPAIAYAVRHPERVSHLMLWCPVVDGSVHVRNVQLQAIRQVLETDWELYTQTVAHSLLGWSEADASLQFAEFIRAGITQETAQVLIPEIHKLNVLDLLPQIRCPTLVLHRPELPLFPEGSMERVAAAIPDARLALFEGNSAVPYLGDWRAIIRAIHEFLGVTAVSTKDVPSARALRLLSMKRDSLTPREKSIVDLVVRGLTNRQIAEELYLSEKTVENHIGRILTKLDLPSRTRLAAYAVEQGLVESA